MTTAEIHKESLERISIALRQEGFNTWWEKIDKRYDGETVWILWVNLSTGEQRLSVVNGKIASVYKLVEESK